MDDDREAGLPLPYQHTDALQSTVILAKGVVRAVYPELWRVDIEPDTGGMIHKAVVIGPHFPPVHKDVEHPSHVYFQHAYGHAADAVCWPLTFRRFLDKDRELTAAQGKNAHSQAERGETAGAPGAEAEPAQHYYHLHVYTQRAGDITISISADQVWTIRSEAGDLLRLDQEKREIDFLAPTLRLGSMEDTRIEYSRGEHVHVVMPEIIMGTLEESRIEYKEDDHVHVVMPEIVLGTLDNTRIEYKEGSHVHLVIPEILLGSASSSERLLLGNAWMTFFNQFIQMLNLHTHIGVTVGQGVSGIPLVPATPMQDDLLSDVAKTQKSA